MRVFLIFLVLCAGLMAKDEFFGGEKVFKKQLKNDLLKKKLIDAITEG